jgi:hypothetical protein
MRGWKTHSSELQFLVDGVVPKPDIIVTNEARLNESVDDKEISLAGYTLIGRCDHPGHRGEGGVLTLARSSLASDVTLLGCDAELECVWMLVHEVTGPVLVACWCIARPRNLWARYEPAGKGSISNTRGPHTQS